MPRQLMYNTLRPKGFLPPLGQKQVYLPSFTITLLRSPELPPRLAKFQVPLRFNKLDLKDYLYHAYGVPVLSVKSWLTSRKGRRRLSPHKFMIAEMEDPFVWPEEETNFEAWDKEIFDSGKKMRDDQLERAKLGMMAPQGDLGLLRDQAKALLEGKEKWQPTWITQKSITAQNKSTQY